MPRPRHAEPAQHPTLLIARVLLFAIGLEWVRDVTDLGHGGEQLAQLRDRRIPRELGAMATEVDADVDHARTAPKLPLDQPRTRRTADPLDRERRALDAIGIAARETALDFLIVE